MPLSAESQNDTSFISLFMPARICTYLNMPRERICAGAEIRARAKKRERRISRKKKEMMMSNLNITNE
jgi:hypothetical protein